MKIKKKTKIRKDKVNKFKLRKYDVCGSNLTYLEMFCVYFKSNSYIFFYLFIFSFQIYETFF